MRSYLLLALLAPSVAWAELGATEPAEDAALAPQASEGNGQTSAVQSATGESAPAKAATPAGLPRFGLLVAAGVPSGVSASFLFRPVRAFRLHAGPAWNYVSWGVQGGATFIPWAWRVAPTLSLEAGRYFDADLTWLVKDSGGVPVEVKPLLQHVGYAYASALVGVEIGSQRGLAFSLRAGLAYFSVTAHGSVVTTTSGGTAGANDAQVTLTNPQLHATSPSLQLGVQYYF